MSLLIYVDTTEAEVEIDRVGRQPDAKMRALLDAVLVQGFVATQIAVHVRTASLKTSGDEVSHYKRALHTWEGNITYGGPSLSVNNPVDYAIYEQRRGGTHDFIAPALLIGPLYVAAILRGLEKS